MLASLSQQSIERMHGMRERGDDSNPVVDRMVGAARAWLQQRAALRGQVMVTRLSSEEHAALKAQMLAAVDSDLAGHPDLDHAIVYLQALGKLATADDADSVGDVG